MMRTETETGRLLLPSMMMMRDEPWDEKAWRLCFISRDTDGSGYIIAGPMPA